MFTLKCLDLGTISGRDSNLVFENEAELIDGMSAVAASSEVRPIVFSV